MWATIAAVWSGFWTWLRDGGFFAAIGKVVALLVFMPFAFWVLLVLLASVGLAWQQWQGQPFDAAQSKPTQPAQLAAAAAVAQAEPVNEIIMGFDQRQATQIYPDKDSPLFRVPRDCGLYFIPPVGGKIEIWEDKVKLGELTREQAELPIKEQQRLGILPSRIGLRFTLRGEPAGAVAEVETGPAS